MKRVTVLILILGLVATVWFGRAHATGRHPDPKPEPKPSPVVVKKDTSSRDRNVAIGAVLIGVVACVWKCGEGEKEAVLVEATPDGTGLGVRYVLRFKE